MVAYNTELGEDKLPTKPQRARIKSGGVGIVGSENFVTGALFILPQLFFPLIFH